MCVCVCVCVYQIYTYDTCIPGLAKCRCIAAQASTGQTGQPQQYSLQQLGTADTGLWGTLASAVIIIKTNSIKKNFNRRPADTWTRIHVCVCLCVCVCVCVCVFVCVCVCGVCVGRK